MIADDVGIFKWDKGLDSTPLDREDARMTRKVEIVSVPLNEHERAEKRVSMYYPEWLAITDSPDDDSLFNGLEFAFDVKNLGESFIKVRIIFEFLYYNDALFTRAYTALPLALRRVIASKIANNIHFMEHEVWIPENLKYKHELHGRKIITDKRDWEFICNWLSRESGESLDVKIVEFE